MPATTTVTILTSTPELAGTATITQGLASGDLNRQVTITAIPRAGYKFERYNITYEDIELTALNVGTYFPLVENALNNMCAAPFSQAQQTLYYDRNDGFKVFADSGGVTDAAEGYYKASSNQYYTTFSGVLQGLFTCPTIDDGGGGGRGNE